MSATRRATVFTHSTPANTTQALGRLIDQARSLGVTLRFDELETTKHHLEADSGVVVDAPIDHEVDVCVVLGGDGTILRALRHYACTAVPVFSINFGEVGFLATVSEDGIDDGLRHALVGDFELLKLPAIVVDTEHGSSRAFNDVAVHRRAGERVARVAYALNGEELGSVRGDGLVVATPAGSTGYNLANGGPVMAWGVGGFVVSFIAPHSLTARALVAAPDDTLAIHNRSRDALDVAVDGRLVGELAAGATLDARFQHNMGTIAQLPGYSFYGRLREKFGLLAH